MLRKTVATLAVALLGQSVAWAQSGASDAASSGAIASPSPFEASQATTSAKRRSLGYGRLTTNDIIGDGKDRWRTGSITMSRAFGFGWDGQAPERFGQLLETRIQGQIIAPDNLRRVDLTDRPWAGALSFGVHSHSMYKGLEMAVGADLVVIGPQTQLDSLQSALHRVFGTPEPSDAVLALQIPNKIQPTVVAELGRTYQFTPTSNIRPFMEARAGDETLLRVGADMNFGVVGLGELLSRESITGQRYRVIYNSTPGTSFTLGGDLAYVANSVYLPSDRGYEVEQTRQRLRAGFHWQGENGSAFYGLTYLGPEFVGQSEGQVTGSIRLKFKF